MDELQTAPHMRMHTHVHARARTHISKPLSIVLKHKCHTETESMCGKTQDSISLFFLLQANVSILPSKRKLHIYWRVLKQGWVFKCQIS